MRSFRSRIVSRAQPPPRQDRLSRWWIPAVAIASALLFVNVIGLFTSLRNPAIYDDPKLRKPVTLTEDELWKQINSYDGKHSQAYAIALTDALHNGMAHYWEDEGIDKYNLRIPFHENYLLNLASYIYPPMFRKYEFAYYKRAIERGVGLCSQMALVEARVLRNAGLTCRMVSLSKHVVVEGQVDGERWWILDPNYGVVIPHGMDEIRRAPELVRDHYREAGWDEPTVDGLVDIYAHEKIKVFRTTGGRWYHLKKWYGERIAYVLIWAMPIGMLTAFGIVALRHRHAHLA
jgi:hypothetical protein